MYPVTICMSLTVLLVKVLNEHGDTKANAVYMASIYYDKNEDDSLMEKFM